MGKTKSNSCPQQQPQKAAPGLDVCFLCGTGPATPCPDCGLVSTCGESHRQLHRPEKLCFPFRIEFRPAVGRFMVATRDIQPLELILYDRTLAYGPKMSSPVVCLQCLKPIEKLSFRCPGCQWPMCNEKCASGNMHKEEECSIIAKGVHKVDFSSPSAPNDHYRFVAPLRLLLLRDSQPEFYDRFKFLMDHNEERRKDPKLWETYSKYVNKFIREDLDLSERFSNEEIDRAVGLYWTNAFACNSGGGQAVFPSFSFASHSCISNANHVVFPNRHLALQAKKLIRQGEELTISYISAIQSTLRRHSKLRDKWFFSCGCPRCSDSTECGSHVSSLICQLPKRPGGAIGEEASCAGVLVAEEPLLGAKTDWVCERCQNRIEGHNILMLENDIARQLQELSDSSSPGEEDEKESMVASKKKKAGLPEFRSLYESFLPILHKNHYLLLLLKRHIIVLSSESFREMGIPQLKEIKEMCEEVLGVLNIVDPGYNRDRGVVLRHLSEANKLLYRKMFGSELITQDQFTRKVQECMILFEESQKCMSMIVKK